MFLINYLDRIIRGSTDDDFVIFDHGVKYPDGHIDWDPEGSIFTQRERELFVERYERDLRKLGIAKPYPQLEFVERQIHISFPHGIVPSAPLTEDQISDTISKLNTASY